MTTTPKPKPKPPRAPMRLPQCNKALRLRKRALNQWTANTFQQLPNRIKVLMP